jgi:hypothetical protein
MDIFSFSVHFTDEESCVLHYKGQRDKQESFVINVAVMRITGLKTRLRININPVMHDRLCEVVLY